ncbi:MAG: L,D-transpeptidase family protein, partial [Gammaproteobacteria bacterium]|nr:L,D-transpeptidase family protein [Gammaproteobacteria bacterium]
MQALIRLALLGISLIATLAAPAVFSDDLQNAIRVEIERLRISGQLSLGDVHIASGDLLAELYERRNFQPAWTTTAQIDSLLAAIEDSYLEGFNPADYNLEKIRLAQQLLSNKLLPHQRAVIDLAFTDSLIRLGYHHRFGKVNPYNLDAHWNFVRELSTQDSVTLIQQAIDDANIHKTLADLFPQVSVYARLEEALAKYRQLAADGGWPVIPGGPLIKPGGTDERLPLISQRVHISGDLPSPANTTSTLYDETLQAAIRRFQFRHGLAEDGVMGPATFAAMNVSVEHRIDQIRASLERARWAVYSIPDDYIIVNIAGFSARLVRDRATVWETKAVVGIEYHKTPVFRGDVKYVVLNPTWTVPYSIATKEMLPRIKQDPTSYFAERDFDIKDKAGRLVNSADVDWQQLSRGNFGYTFIQRP